MCETMVGKVSLLVGCAKWTDVSNETCPTCRSKVRKVTDDFRAKNLLDVYLTMNPSKSRLSSETAELDAEYKRGDNVLIRQLSHGTDLGRLTLPIKLTMTTFTSVMKTMNR